jgi:hypothetical protein
MFTLQTSRVEGEVSKYKNTPIASSVAVERFFQSQEFLLLMMIEDSLLVVKSASGLNFYQDSGPSPLVD